MDIRFSAILYSKYSQSSKSIIEAAKKLNWDIRQQIKPTPVCVDSKEIRDTILNSTLVQVTVVPTILVAYNDGAVEKYEGEAAFKWVESLKPPEQSPREVPDTETYTRQLESMAAKMAALERQLVEVPPNTSSTPQRPRQAKAPSKKGTTKITALENLAEISDDEPLEEYNEYEESEEDPVIEGNVSQRQGGMKPDSALQQKQDALHTTAADLQKERELLEESIAKQRRRV